MCTLSLLKNKKCCCILLASGIYAIFYVFSTTVTKTSNIDYWQNKEIVHGCKFKHSCSHFPRIIHRVFGFWDNKLSDAWKANLNSCQEKTNNFKVMVWNKSNSFEFLKKEYPWFVGDYLSYRYPVQQADAIRYFILHHYGGIYLDMDIKCKNKTTLSKFYNNFAVINTSDSLDTVALPTEYGITNFFMFSKCCTDFMTHVLRKLKQANSWYVFPYATVMFSTGPAFLTISYNDYISSYDDSRRGKLIIMENELFWGQYFEDGGKHGTWHSWDGNILQVLMGNLEIIIGISLFLLILLMYFCLRQKLQELNKYLLFNKEGSLDLDDNQNEQSKI